MRSLFIAVCFTFAAWSCHAGDTVEGVSVEVFHVAVSGGKAQPSLGSVQGVSILRDRFDVLEKSADIPLLKGHGLAVTFTLTGKYKDLESVRLVVKHPEMKAPTGEVYSKIDRVQKSLLVDGARVVAFSYAFDEEWELVEGIWTIQIFSGATRLGEAQLITHKALPSSEASITDVIPKRLGALCAVVELSTDDVFFLKQLVVSGGVNECLSRAVLFRHSPSEFGDEFRRYFAIDRSLAASVLTNDEINSRVNGLLKESEGRHPAEVVARIYLAMRGSGLAAKKPDGTELRLEVMFRASVFAAVAGGSKEEMLRFAAEADRK